MSDALKRFQQLVNELPVLEFDEVNPHFRKGYVSVARMVAAITPLLVKYELSFTLELQSNLVVGKITDEKDGNTVLSSTYPLPENFRNLSSHARGSELTYSRRYLMAMMFNLKLADKSDDDGNAAAEVMPAPVMSNDEQLARLRKATKDIFVGDAVLRFVELTCSKRFEELTRAAAEKAILWLEQNPDTRQWDGIFKAALDQIISEENE